jgi:hypothetical protein
MILEKMERQHPSSYDERKGIPSDLLIVQMPSSPDERRFYTDFEVLGAPYLRATRLARSRGG